MDNYEKLEKTKEILMDMLYTKESSFSEKEQRNALYNATEIIETVIDNMSKWNLNLKWGDYIKHN